jgi:Cu+-exporting ATPase
LLKKRKLIVLTFSASQINFQLTYLPVVLGIAGLTYWLSRDPLATAAVLLVACSCSIALATPIAILASIGAAARHGLIIKGGRYLERLAQVDVLLIDKTGTLTLGKPEIVDFRFLAGEKQRKNSNGENDLPAVEYDPG